MMTFDEEFKKPHFKKVLEEADISLLSSKIAVTFPYSMKAFIKEQTNAKIVKSSKAGAYGIDFNSFGSDDAVWFQCDNKNIIIYNDEIESKQRVRFSLGHEGGHIKLNHDQNNKNLYSKYEIEANFFAAQILMPEQVINELLKRGKHVDANNLMRWFNVSKQAADKRIEMLKKIDYSRRTLDEKENDKLLLSKYKNFVDSIAPITSYYSDPYEEEEEQRKRDSWY